MESKFKNYLLTEEMTDRDVEYIQKWLIQTENEWGTLKKVTKNSLKDKDEKQLKKQLKEFKKQLNKLSF